MTAGLNESAGSEIVPEVLSWDLHGAAIWQIIPLSKGVQRDPGHTPRGFINSSRKWLESTRRGELWKTPEGPYRASPLA